MVAVQIHDVHVWGEAGNEAHANARIEAGGDGGDLAAHGEPDHEDAVAADVGLGPQPGGGRGGRGGGPPRFLPGGGGGARHRRRGEGGGASRTIWAGGRCRWG